MLSIKDLFQNRLHSYQKSEHKEIYEQLAQDYKTTPQRVYKLAHGAHPKNHSESCIIQELLALGIIHHV